jgi:hypothetical protein
MAAIAKSPAEPAENFGWFAPFAGVDAPAPAKRTRAMLGWAPARPGLIADVEHPSYFKT